MQGPSDSAFGGIKGEASPKAVGGDFLELCEHIGVGVGECSKVISISQSWVV